MTTIRFNREVSIVLHSDICCFDGSHKTQHVRHKEGDEITVYADSDLGCKKRKKWREATLLLPIGTPSLHCDRFVGVDPECFDVIEGDA